jgi:hypothetical protein
VGNFTILFDTDSTVKQKNIVFLRKITRFFVSFRNLFKNVDFYRDSGTIPAMNTDDRHAALGPYDFQGGKKGAKKNCGFGGTVPVHGVFPLCPGKY